MSKPMNIDKWAKYRIFHAILTAFIADVLEYLSVCPRRGLMNLAYKYRPKISRGFVKAERSPEEHMAEARARLQKAYELLKYAPDEAGEEAWRATLSLINAMSVYLWGIEAKSHKAVRHVKDKIAEFLEAQGHARIANIIRVNFGNAQSLHENYYDPEDNIKTIKANIERVEELEEITNMLIHGGLVSGFDACLRTIIINPLLLLTDQLYTIYLAIPDKNKIKIANR